MSSPQRWLTTLVWVHDHLHPAQEPHEHRDVRGGGARAAVFGLSDGLVTNISLVLGVAGASPGGQVVRLVGVAGLVAGAFSMAAGEYLSMTAQRELMERELDVERASLSQSPEGEALELRGMYEQRGIDPEVARDMVHEVMADPQLALETHAREELGISPEHLGRPLQSALSSFFTFALGAFIPLVPWLVTKGNGAIVASAVLERARRRRGRRGAGRLHPEADGALGAAAVGHNGRRGSGDLRGGPGDRDGAGLGRG